MYYDNINILNTYCATIRYLVFFLLMLELVQLYDLVYLIMMDCDANNLVFLS